MTHSFTKRLTAVASLFALLVSVAACDFNQINNPADNFDLIIQMPSINTVVNGQIVDGTTMKPIKGDVTLTFSGEDANTLIDAYSDPISELKVKTGLVSFGVENSVTPSQDDPVSFTVGATAEGYTPNSREVVVAKDGGEFLLKLYPDDPNAEIVGTSAAQVETGHADDNGLMTDDVVVATPETAGALAGASIKLPAGTIARTADGTPLRGQLKATVRAFDSEAGLSALPEVAKRDEDGNVMAVVGAVSFRIEDEAGNVAVQFEGASTGKNGSGLVLQGTITVAGRMNPILPGVLTRDFEPEHVRWHASTSASSMSLPLHHFVTELRRDESSPLDQILAWTSPPNQLIGPQDLSSLFELPSNDIILTASYEPPSTPAQSLGAMAELIRNQNPDVPTVLSNVNLTGPGVNIQRGSNLTLESGTDAPRLRLAEILQQKARVMQLPDAEYTLSALVNGVPTETVVPDLSSGVNQLQIPDLPPSREIYQISASLACPAGQKFEVQLTESSIDALSVSYVLKGSEEALTFVNKSEVKHEVTESSINASMIIMLEPSSTYAVSATYGSETAERDITTPASGGPFHFDFDPNEAGLTCKNI